jgi:hypothetical protein
MAGLLGIKIDGFKLPSFLNKNEIVAPSNNATISNRKYTASKNVKCPNIDHSNDARIVNYNPLQNC